MIDWGRGNEPSFAFSMLQMAGRMDGMADMQGEVRQGAGACLFLMRVCAHAKRHLDAHVYRHVYTDRRMDRYTGIFTGRI